MTTHTGVFVIASALMLISCTAMTTPDKTQAVSYTLVCVLAQCETADEIDRVGDPKAIGDVNEQVQEGKQIEQSQEAELDVRP